jgi:hypothetical protein
MNRQSKHITLLIIFAVVWLWLAPSSNTGAAQSGDPPLRLASSNGDAFADLVVGVPGEGIGDTELAGAANVLHGSLAGLSDRDNRFWHQDSPGILDSAEGQDEFGKSLTTGDFDGDGYVDLAVGVPGEDVGDVIAAGMVNVLYGSAGGLSEARNQFWHQDSPGILDDAEEYDWFGYTMTCMPGTGTVYRVHLPAVIR